MYVRPQKNKSFLLERTTYFPTARRLDTNEALNKFKLIILTYRCSVVLAVLIEASSRKRSKCRRGVVPAIISSSSKWVRHSSPGSDYIYNGNSNRNGPRNKARKSAASPHQIVSHCHMLEHFRFQLLMLFVCIHCINVSKCASPLLRLFHY